MERRLSQPQTDTPQVDSGRIAASLSRRQVPKTALVAPKPQTVSPTVGAVESFEGVLPEFLQLSGRISNRNLFVEPEWLEAYVKAFELSSETLALTARQNRRLTGVLPLVRSVERWHGLPVRILRPPANSHCHSFEVPREDGPCGTEALRAILGALETLHDWDVLELPRLPASTSTLGELLSLAREKRWHAAQGPSATDLFVGLKIGVGKKIDAPWQSAATERQRRDLCRTDQLVKTELGGWICFETIVQPTPEQLGLFFQLESPGWGAKKPSSLGQKFYTEIARTYARSGRFLLNFLFLQDQVAAAQIAVRTGDRVCGLKLAYDERFSRYSPRSLLINGTLRLCWEKGIRRFHMGPETDYNRRWTSQKVHLVSYSLFGRGFYPRLLYHYFTVRPRLSPAYR